MYLKQNDKALSDFNEAIRLKPDSADIFANRAGCYEKLGNNKAAQRDRARAKELIIATPTPTPVPTYTSAAKG